MDGVIIDSEPLWKKAIINTFKNIGFDFTIEMCNTTKGMRIDQVTVYWKNKLNASFNPREVEQQIIKNVIKLIHSDGIEMEGLIDNLKRIKNNNLKIGLASSSPFIIINAVIEKLNIKDYFDFVHSAEEEEYGKPHPQVFITTATKLNVLPSECFVIEDSLNGIIAAKAALMKVIALPEKEEKLIKKFIIADKIVNNHNEISF